MTQPSFIQLLQATAAAANRATSIEEAARSCLDQVCAYMGWPLGHLLVCGRRSGDAPGMPASTDVWYISDPERFRRFREATEGLTFGAGETLPGRVVESGKAVWVTNITAASELARAGVAEEAGIKTAFAFPVPAETGVEGVLEFFSPAALEPDEALIELMTGIGVQLGRVIDRRHVQQALQESETRYRALVEQASDAIAVYDEAGRLSEVNTRASEMTGYTREELLAMNVSQVIAPEDLASTPLRIEALRNGQAMIGERVLCRKDGSYLPVELSARMLKDGSIQTILRDITQRKLAEEQIKRLNVDLEKRVQERTSDLQQANEELARAIARTEEAVHVRDELLSVVSHDLKNPLAAIMGNTQMLERRLARLSAVGPVEAVQFLALVERIDRSAKKMHTLVDELLDFGRLQAGQSLTLQLRPSDLVELVRQVIEEQQQSTRYHRIKLHAEVPALVAPVDVQRLERVLSNLLANAIKYSPNGGDIDVTVSQEAEEAPRNVQAGGWAIISVHDRGLGIAPQEIQHIFEWFRRAQQYAGRISGAGIGLASAHQIVEQHKGTILVESKEGEGSTFTLRLPL